MTLVHTEQASLTAAVPIDRAAILKALNINVNDPKSQALILACERYGLDPLLKHAVLISGNLYVTRDGLLAVAHRDGRLDGIVIEEEGENAEEWWAKVTVHVKGMSHGFTYRGRYPKSGQQRKYGPEMAVKCAEVMALRRAFGVTGVPTVEEQWDIELLVTAEQMARIDELLSLVPEAAMADLRAWKEREQITMQRGSFTAEMADRVIGHLVEVVGGEGSPHESDGGGHQSSTAPTASDEGTGTGGEDTPPPPGAVTPWKATDPDEWARWNRRCQAKAAKALPDAERRDAQRHGLAVQASRKLRGHSHEVESWNDVTEAEARAIEDALELLKAGDAVMTLDDDGVWGCERMIVAGEAPRGEPDGDGPPSVAVPPPPENVTGGEGQGGSVPSQSVAATGQTPSGDTDDIVDAELVDDDPLDLLRQAMAEAKPRWTTGKAVKRAWEIATEELGLQHPPGDFDALARPEYAPILARLAVELGGEAA